MAPCTCMVCVQSLSATLDSQILSHTSDEECWATFGQMNPDEDSTTPEEVAALREFAEAYRSENPMPSAEAACRLMSLSEDRVPCDGDYDKGYRISWLLWDAGIDMPHHQPAILSVIDAVQSLPRLDATPEQENRFGHNLEQWRTLEEFWDNCWYEKYQRFWESRYPAEQLDGLGFPGFVRANAFKAHRLAMYPPKVSRSGELSVALRNIVFTLELDPWNHVPPGRPASEEVRGVMLWGTLAHEQYITMLNTNVHALIPFFDIAGNIIYEWTDRKTKVSKFTPGEYPEGSREYLQSKSACMKSRHPEADLWNGDEWVTRERWAFWKERLVWVSGQTELMQRTRDEATMLVQMMKDIESRSAQHAS